MSGAGALLGAVEAGGTKVLCAVGTAPDDLRDRTRLPTTTPDETIDLLLDFFRDHDLAAVGIGSFGPVDPDPDSPSWGHITTTPKPGWADVDLAGRVGRALDVPVGFDTDVNAAALGEGRWGAARGLSTFIYLTVGTGIGGGGLVEGRPLHGLLHPEMGHVRVRRDPDADPYSGCCPYHGDCLEGLAAGPALEERWGMAPKEMPDDHAAWELEADYLAQAVAGYVLTLSPERVIMGGGIMRRRRLFPLVRERVKELLGGYLRAPAITDAIDDYIVPPGLGELSGLAGGLVLAQEALAAIG